MSVQVAFPLQDLKQIKGDLGKFSDDQDTYIETLRNLTQVFELSWKDTMLLLNQTPTSSERKVALQATERVGDDKLLVYQIKIQDGTLSRNPSPQEHRQCLPMIPNGIPILPWETGRGNTFWHVSWRD